MMSWMTLVTQFVSHNKRSFADPNNWRASLAPDMTSLNTIIALLLLCSFNSTFRSSILSILAAKVCIVVTVVRENCRPVGDDRKIISANGEIHVGIENRTERHSGTGLSMLAKGIRRWIAPGWWPIGTFGGTLNVMSFALALPQSFQYRTRGCW
jgi:hypothetical protein